MAELPRYVVDASVAGKWFVHDETDEEVAQSVLADFDQGRIALLAPSHFLYEVSSVISRTVGGGRITPEQGRIAVREFLSLNLNRPGFCRDSDYWEAARQAGKVC